jgi:4-amino-4-deoxy-L-arabinose transferase-like glycosyltransferase
VLAFVLHLAASGRYGYFRDELYFIVCGWHPAFGYVDQPPLIPLIAVASYWLFHGSLTLFRLFPALCHAALIVLTAETVRLLGGGRFACVLAALAVWTGAVYQAEGTILSTDAAQPLCWLFCAHAAIRAVRGGDPRWWLAAGAVAGVWRSGWWRWRSGCWRRRRGRCLRGGGCGSAWR